MDGLHGVGPLVQRPHKLEVEDAADQAANAAGGKEDHLEGGGATGGGRRQTGEDSQKSARYQLHPRSAAPAGLMNGSCACSSRAAAQERSKSLAVAADYLLITE